MMPARSEAQRIAMAIAEHHPEKLYNRNRGLLKMSRQQLSEYASTKQKGLPYKIISEAVAREKKKRG